jgi:hypothetical protein
MSILRYIQYVAVRELFCVTDLYHHVKKVMIFLLHVFMCDAVLSQEEYICRAAKRCRSAESHIASGAVKAGRLW